MICEARNNVNSCNIGNNNDNNNNDDDNDNDNDNDNDDNNNNNHFPTGSRYDEVRNEFENVVGENGPDHKHDLSNHFSDEDLSTPPTNYVGFLVRTKEHIL